MGERGLLAEPMWKHLRVAMKALRQALRVCFSGAEVWAEAMRMLKAVTMGVVLEIWALKAPLLKDIFSTPIRIVSRTASEKS